MQTLKISTLFGKKMITFVCMSCEGSCQKHAFEDDRTASLVKNSLFLSYFVFSPLCPFLSFPLCPSLFYFLCTLCLYRRAFSLPPSSFPLSQSMTSLSVPLPFSPHKTVPPPVCLTCEEWNTNDSLFKVINSAW